MINLILMASGFGRRFGSNKLLYLLDGKPLYQYAFDLLEQVSKKQICGHTAKVIVVTQYDEIEAKAKEYGFCSIHNDNAAEGIAASVRLGVQASVCMNNLRLSQTAASIPLDVDATSSMMQKEDDWYVFFTADQPGLKPETVCNYLYAAIQSQKSMASVYSDQSEAPGNPTIFFSLWKDELLQLKGDKGGRKIMKRYPDEVFWYAIPETEIEDIDYKKI